MTYLLAFAAGSLSVGAFSPFDWWWLLLPSLGLLFGLWMWTGGGAAFRLGLCFGFGQFGFGVSWVYISIQTFGGMPPVLAGLCVFGLVLWLSLFPALTGWLQAKFRRLHPVARLLAVIPVTWTLLEWTRGWLFSGMPWLSNGYAMLETPLVGLAPLGGVYLVGLLTSLAAGVLAMLFVRPGRVALVSLLLPALALLTGFLLDSHSWTRGEGDPIDVAIIQNNVPLRNKWNPDNRVAILQEYMDRSMELGDSDLVVWPEGAVPDYLENLPLEFWQTLAIHPADFVLGTLHRPPGGNDYYNTLAVVSDELHLYNKQHLVPFGEFFPMERLLDPILRHLTMPMADFSSWRSPQESVPVAGNRAAASICYEDAFPHEWRNQVAAAGFLINISEDMWFGDSLAPHQRLQMARFRAREMERPMVRSSNNGLSSLIDWRGRVTAVAPQFEKAVVTGTVSPRTGTTPFVRWGDWPALFLAGVMLVVALLFGRVPLGYNAR
jgi:apolipoprotein N-acyltransferase